MQPPSEAGLTVAEAVSLLQSDTIQPVAGLELVDLALNVVDDISADLDPENSSVARNSYAEMHATGQFAIARQLDWGAALIRPYMTISNGSLTGRWNLGVYHTSTPETSTAETPQTFQVDGYDVLLRLNQPVGDTYAIATGDSYLAKAEEILLGRGYVAYLIDQSAAATAAPAPRVWAFDDQVTWLTVVNDLLASIGYQGIWADWDGRLRCEPYVLPQDRQVEWTYTDNPITTMLGQDMRSTRDFVNAPNRWVIYRQNNVDGPTPVEGDGMFTFQNDSVGDTSVDARGGLVIPKVVGVDAADHAALLVQAQRIIQTDMDVPTIWTVTSSPNPAHWHFDRLFADTAALLADVQCTSWSLPLNGSDMQQTWRVVAQ